MAETKVFHMRINIDTSDPRWSPTQRMILEQVKDRLQQEPRRPTDAAVAQTLDRTTRKGAGGLRFRGSETPWAKLDERVVAQIRKSDESDEEWARRDWLPSKSYPLRENGTDVEAC